MCVGILFSQQERKTKTREALDMRLWIFQERQRSSSIACYYLKTGGRAYCFWQNDRKEKEHILGRGLRIISPNVAPLWFKDYSIRAIAIY
jgi:hypothetical protein